MTVIVVDDGLATGSTMLAAVAALRSQGPGADRGRRPDRSLADVRCPGRGRRRGRLPPNPVSVLAVGLSYDDFSEVGDEEVQRLLEP